MCTQHKQPGSMTRKSIRLLWPLRVVCLGVVVLSQLPTLQVVICIVQYNAGVGTAVAKCLRASSSQPILWPRRKLGRHVQIPLVPLDLWVRLLARDGWWDQTIFQYVYHLDYGRKTSASL